MTSLKLSVGPKEIALHAGKTSLEDLNCNYRPIDYIHNTMSNNNSKKSIASLLFGPADSAGKL